MSIESRVVLPYPSVETVTGVVVLFILLGNVFFLRSPVIHMGNKKRKAHHFEISRLGLTGEHV